MILTNWKKQLNNKNKYRNKISVPRVIFLEEEKIERFKWFSILRIDCKNQNFGSAVLVKSFLIIGQKG